MSLSNIIKSIFTKEPPKPVKKVYVAESQRRFLITRQGCPYCAKWTGIISRINTKLEPSRMIHLIDATLFYKFGIPDHPILERFGKQIEDTGFPYLYIDGILRSGAFLKEENEGFLLGILSAKGELT